MDETGRESQSAFSRARIYSSLAPEHICVRSKPVAKPYERQQTDKFGKKSVMDLLFSLGLTLRYSCS